MKRIALIFAAAVAVILSSGCGTMFARAGNGFEHTICGSNEKLGIFPGPRPDAKALWNTPVLTIDGQPCAPLFIPFWIADMPVSTVVDTCMLPIDLKEN